MATEHSDPSKTGDTAHEPEEKEAPEALEKGSKVWLIVSLLPKPVQPYAIQLLGYAVLLGTCLAGIAWADGRVDNHIRDIQASSMEVVVSKNDAAVTEIHRVDDDHEKRLQLLEKTASETHDAVIEMRASVKVLSDHDAVRYSRGR